VREDCSDEEREEGGDERGDGGEKFDGTAEEAVENAVGDGGEGGERKYE
jgi:hypothetical protein